MSLTCIDARTCSVLTAKTPAFSLQLGVFAARGVISKERYYAMERYKLLFTKGAEEYLNLKFTNLHLTFTLTSTVLSAYHLYTNDWIVSNLIGLAFSFNAVSLIRLDSFKTGTILLSGLFLYDIYWVFFSSKTFGTSVMVRVSDWHRMSVDEPAHWQSYSHLPEAAP